MYSGFKGGRLTSPRCLAVFLAVLILAISGIIRNGFDHRRPREPSITPRSFTLGLLSQSYFTLFYRSSVDTNFWQYAEKYAANPDSLRSWVGLVCKNPAVDIEQLTYDPKRGPQSRFSDGWGGPLNVILLTDNSQFTGLNTNLVPPFVRLVIWSSGPNRTNEQGWYDDVWLSKDRIEKIRKTAVMSARE